MSWQRCLTHTVVIVLGSSLIASIHTFTSPNFGLRSWPEDYDHFSKSLTKFLKPRVVGSAGHQQVRHFILRELDALDMRTETDIFTEKVPQLGLQTFTNIIGTFNSNATRFLTLACHYDSKYFPDNPNFLGATNSAVPCAVLLNTVKTLSSFLENNLVLPQKDIGLMLIFFDGEEGFENWHGKDSLYGSRHLAKMFSKRQSPMHIRRVDQIEVFVLLNLIGGGDNPKFYSRFPNTHALHARIYEIERALQTAGQLEGTELLFINGYLNSLVRDDHVPFLKKSVPILHIIPEPFPAQYHTSQDDSDHLNWRVIRNFIKIFRTFVYEYLNRHKGPVNLRKKPRETQWKLVPILRRSKNINKN